MRLLHINRQKMLHSNATGLAYGANYRTTCVPALVAPSVSASWVQFRTVINPILWSNPLSLFRFRALPYVVCVRRGPFIEWATVLRWPISAIFVALVRHSSLVVRHPSHVTRRWSPVSRRPPVACRSSSASE